eukprot:1318730-Pyramimonas_sp.AAC.1
MRLEYEARVGMGTNPPMDVWPWMVMRAGWVIERYVMRANQRAAFEGSFGKKCQCEALKSGEFALLRLAVAATGKVRAGVRQGRADPRFVGGIWLGKTI